MKICLGIALPLLLLLAPGRAQEPAATGAAGRAANDKSVTAAAITGSKEDPAAFNRGAALYTANCAGCHGATARGGAGAPDLVRSLLVLDDEKGILIAPVLRNGRPDQGMPKPNLSEAQIADLVAWLHVQTYAAGHRTTYAYQDVLTGDPKKGEEYFATTCASCHSATGDLKGIGSRYDAFSVQARWLQPRGGRGGGRGGRGAAAESSARGNTTVTVTLASGQKIAGTLDRVDDFSVSLRDSAGEYHSFTREGDVPKVEIHDPLKPHVDLLRKYTDADIHNVTAYLVTLK
ncbi:MAG TPA: c-type cytochrome [Candidatus Sulfopaludibacter sp.]|jgi:mono/diheme cytochrome c family protein|nr:c-type cytochrome [Candidatus Sulfopaludibacter sp.]